MDILGVKIDNLSKKEIFKKIQAFLSESKFHQIATVNPEFILEAQKNLPFKNILNNCDLNIADGFGIKLAFLRFGQRLKCRLAGADLMMEILRIAENKGISVFLAVNKDGLSSFEEIKEVLLKIYPDLRIYGENLDCHAELVSVSPEILKQVQDDTILLCNFGAPYQELFINSVKCANIRLAMGVGGSFDFLTGKIKRAPKFMRFLGLEWLWRLIQQPKRFKRIWNATIIFPYKFLLDKK